MNKPLTEDFLVDLAKSCIVSKDILDVVKQHLQYSYLPNQQYKEIFKYLFDYHNANNSSPTIGLLSENVRSRDCLETIGKIRKSNVYDIKKQLIKTLEKYIKQARLFLLFEKVEDIHNPTGKNDPERAMQVLAEESVKINEFSLHRKMYKKVFAQFEQRQLERKTRDYSTRKIPTGIPALDYHTRGGIDLGTSLLGIARSGVGKTTFLRSLAMNAAMRGFNVLFLAAADSTEDEVEVGFDSWWTGVEIHSMKEGDISGVDSKKIEKAIQSWRSQCGEIVYHVFRDFDEATIADGRAVLIDLLREMDIHLVCWDYLEMFGPGDGKRYSTNQEGTTSKKKATGQKIVNVGTEFDIVCASMTQASDIKKEQWDNSNWVITRNDISNLKAAVDPFSYCVTLNQTEDENDRDIMRIHDEKLRHYKIRSWESTYPIAQKRELGRFIDLPRTLREFWDAPNKKIIRNLPKK